MRIAINTETRRVVTWAGAAIESLQITRGDSFPLEIKFIQGNGYVDVPENTAARVAFKAVGEFASEILAGSVLWQKAGVGSKAVYSMALNFNTTPIEGLFASEPASLNLVMEFEWSYSINSQFIRQTTIPVPVVLANDYARDADGTPVEALNMKASQQEAVAGVDDTKWMTPLSTKQAIDAAATSGAVLTLAGIELM
jgi:hypothetical protein